MPSDSAGVDLGDPDAREQNTLGDGRILFSDDDSVEISNSAADLPLTLQTRPIAPPKQYQPTLIDGELHLPRAGEDAPSSSRYPFLLPPERPDEIGRLGNYRVLHLLGKGGMGYVFLAEDIDLGRRVALKVMRPNLGKDPLASQRFLREARTLAAIKHEHLVTVYQVGQEGRVIFLAMEWLQGETLEDWIVREGPANVADSLRLGRQIALGLKAIHQREVVHRDIKPSNLWLEKPNNRVRILDFGLARPIDDKANFTQTGLIVGTPAFMSPEQARGARVDARSDIFSLGGVLYYLCTGVRPFDAENTMALLTALAIYDPRPVHELNPEIPPSLSALIMRMLRKDPDQRPADAETVALQLKRIEDRSSETEVIDLSRFELPDHDDVPAPAPMPKLSEGNRLRWIVAIGSASVLIAAAAIVASVLIKSKPAHDSSMQLIPEQPPKNQQPKEKKSPPVIVQAKPKPIFLSDLKPIDEKNWERTPPNRPRGKGPEDPPPPKEFAGVRFRGQHSPHGIFMHALSNSEEDSASISYSLNKQYDSFHADVALNDGPPQSESPLQFTVYADGKQIGQSRKIQYRGDTDKFSFPVKNVDVLRIEVKCLGDDPRGGHAVWIEPRVVKD